MAEKGSRRAASRNEAEMTRRRDTATRSSARGRRRRRDTRTIVLAVRRHSEEMDFRYDAHLEPFRTEPLGKSGVSDMTHSSTHSEV